MSQAGTSHLVVAFARRGATHRSSAPLQPRSVRSSPSGVLSPQFPIWLIPIVPLVRGRRGLGASALLGVALVLTQIWFPFRYFRLSLDFEEGLSWPLLARDLTLVALVAVLVVTLRRTTATRPESP